MSKNTYIAIAVVVLIVVGGFFLLQGNGGVPVQEQQQEETNQPQGTTGTGNEEVVRYTNEGYAPGEVIISAGDTVTFVNASFTEMWPATAIHPTHTIYPGADIQRCGTPEGSTFDACGAVEPDGSWSFQFNEEGSWGYHDHLNPSNTGRVRVE